MPPRRAPNAVPPPVDRLPIGPIMVGDRLHPGDAPVLRADDRGFLYGDGVFETIRAISGRPQHLDRHLNRLFEALDVLAIGPIGDPPIGERIETLLTACGLGDGESAIRITVSRGAGAGPRPRRLRPTVVISARPLGPGFVRRRAGAALRTVAGPARMLAGLKSLCYLPSVLALAAVEPGEQPLLVADDGAVLEGATGNIFARFGERLVTPAARGDLLPGIARGLLLERAGGAGLVAEQTRLTLDDLGRADGVWITNALLPIAPVSMIDGRLRSIDRYTQPLRALFDASAPSPIGVRR